MAYLTQGNESSAGVSSRKLRRRARSTSFDITRLAITLSAREPARDHRNADAPVETSTVRCGIRDRHPERDAGWPDRATRTPRDCWRRVRERGRRPNVGESHAVADPSMEGR